ncbi:hypothetical protein [Nocardia sp. BMG51109]|uniref:hypothetical protein n=1 Tax=Nocardia sp. BMG51109 TaxID=1056816 RepID=UPI000463D50F|nr:hypothetical protein [Nocardia sp. BMG51109]
MTRPTGAARADTVVRNGIATLGSDATRLLDQLDGVFLGWARRAGAAPMTAPALVEAADLADFQVFRNFPHLMWAAAPLCPSATDVDGIGAEIPADLLEPARLCLPTAVCYGLYPHFRDQAVAEPTLVTARGICFRNETRSEPGLRRLRAFRMREIVVLGTPSQIRQKLTMFGTQLLRFACELDIPVTRDVASDPFYSPAGQAARWQRLRPGKHEIRADGLALASINEHRKFFGEACRIIGQQSGAVVSTGCVGMGLERWIEAIGQRYDGRFGDMSDAVARAAAACAQSDRQELT